MPTIDELDVVCVYVEEQQRFRGSLYRPQKAFQTPRAPKRGVVIWIVRDGKPVNLNKKEEER